MELMTTKKSWHIVYHFIIWRENRCNLYTNRAPCGPNTHLLYEYETSGCFEKNRVNTAFYQKQIIFDIFCSSTPNVNSVSKMHQFYSTNFSIGWLRTLHYQIQFPKKIPSISFFLTHVIRSVVIESIKLSYFHWNFIYPAILHTHQLKCVFPSLPQRPITNWLNCVVESRRKKLTFTRAATSVARTIYSAFQVYSRFVYIHNIARICVCARFLLMANFKAFFVFFSRSLDGKSLVDEIKMPFLSISSIVPQSSSSSSSSSRLFAIAENARIDAKPRWQMRKMIKTNGKKCSHSKWKTSLNA